MTIKKASPYENLVVKDNALIEASYKLSLVEQRLILMAIVEMRKTARLSKTSPERLLFLLVITLDTLIRISTRHIKPCKTLQKT